MTNLIHLDELNHKARNSFLDFLFCFKSLDSIIINNNNNIKGMIQMKYQCQTVDQVKQDMLLAIVCLGDVACSNESII